MCLERESKKRTKRERGEMESLREDGKEGNIERYLLRNFTKSTCHLHYLTFHPHKPYHHIIIPMCCMSEPLSGKIVFLKKMKLYQRRKRTGGGQNLGSEGVPHPSITFFITSLSLPVWHSLLPYSLSLSLLLSIF